MKILALPLIAALAAMSGAARAESAGEPLDISLEDLMRVTVTSVAKKSQTLAQTAAAVHVIQADDIRRSGATSIPEALRLAPGVQVSAIGHNKWAVSIRGQADRYSNKLLVLVDGRSVYTPLFSGVFWEALDVPLENVERIEVIRGPGASIWGANAVNGVINIITRSPFDSLGSTVSLAAGSELRARGMFRHAWQPDADTAVQIHAAAHEHGSSRPLDGDSGADDWRNQSAGFRLERLLESGTLHVQGGASRSRAGDDLLLLGAVPMPAIIPARTTQDIVGAYLMARWERSRADGVSDSLQAYVEYEDFDHVALAQRRHTLDLEYQQRRALGDSHDLIWGLGYRRSGDRIEDSVMFQVDERKRDTDLVSAYVQDEIILVPSRWLLSLGARLERNDYTGYEIQPNARLLWTPDSANSVWLSASRAVRTPARIERGGQAYVQADPWGVPPSVPPSIVRLVSDDLDSEELQGIDLGWRRRLSDQAHLDIAAFHYRYKDLRGAAATLPVLLPPGYLLVETQDNNANSARASGIELALDWRVGPAWRLQAGYSWLDLDVRSAALPGQAPSDYAGASPTHQFSLLSSVDLTGSLRWDAWLRRVSGIDKVQFGAPPISAYTSLDMRLAWQARPDLKISLVGQNLLDKAHREFDGHFIPSTPSEVQRGYYLKLDWKF